MGTVVTVPALSNQPNFLAAAQAYDTGVDVEEGQTVRICSDPADDWYAQAHLVVLVVAAAVLASASRPVSLP